MTIEIPLNWKIGKKRTSLSMNNYRNWHYQTSNKIKKNVCSYLDRFNFPKFKKVHINYTLYFKDKRKRDLMNFVSVVDKFVLDHLVNIECLEDDNYKVVSSYTVAFGGKAEINYIKMEIKEIEN